MKILVVPDKFKGSLTTEEVSAAIVAGLRKGMPEVETQIITASDGGDGFLASVAKYVPNIEDIEEVTVDALARPFPSYFLFDASSETAFIEMAQASGMQALRPSERNPSTTTTYGSGSLAKAAIKHGAKKIYVGLGGSATNDGGIGFAAALGYSFYNQAGENIPITGGGLSQLDHLSRGEGASVLDGIEFFAINDVLNPLFGPEGAAYVYAPQKGATPEDLPVLDAGLRTLHEVVKKDLGEDEADTPGAGAAGGLGYGLRVFCDAEFVSGVEFILRLSGIEEILSTGAIDCIVTGEGKIDDQTAYGKLVRGVAAVGNRHGVPVYAICGALQLENSSVADLGLVKAQAIHREGQDLSYTMENAASLVEEAAAELAAELS